MGKSATEIGEQLSIARTTVVSFLQRFDKRGSEENLRRPGRPRKTSARFDRHLIHAALANSRIPFADLRNIINSDVSVSTIHRRLHEDHIHKWRATERALLTEEHAKKRLKWAREHRTWTWEDWKHVVWSDECAVQKDSDNRQVWIFRHQNEREKYDPKNIRGRTKGGGLSQPIWGCFAGTMLGPIVFINETVNTDVYIGILCENLLPFIDAVIADGTGHVVFQQDNATCHVSKRSREWLSNSGSEHGFSLMQWPPNSPDLNPIEHVWAHLKRELHQRYPDTKSLCGGPDTIRRTLRTRLTEVWRDIGEGVLSPLINSMPHRVQTVLGAQGWYTHY